MTEDSLAQDDGFSEIKARVASLLARVNALMPVLSTVEEQMRAAMVASVGAGEDYVNLRAAKAAAAFSVSVEEQVDRLNTLYNDPNEDPDALQRITDRAGRYYCCEANQANSFLAHTAQLHQFAHRGMLVKRQRMPRGNPGNARF